MPKLANESVRFGDAYITYRSVNIFSWLLSRTESLVPSFSTCRVIVYAPDMLRGLVGCCCWQATTDMSIKNPSTVYIIKILVLEYVGMSRQLNTFSRCIP